MLRGADKWLPGYAASVMRRPRAGAGTRDLVLCVADHFEPFHRQIGTDGIARGGRRPEEARRLVAEWAERYRALARGLRDSDERPPRHTFFYPQDEYDPACLDLVAGLASEGLAEVEIHLHHRNDSADGLRAKLSGFRDTLRSEHGLLGRWNAGRPPAYAFVHGNWALCNSRPDGDWCGVNEELGILAETGCFADCTFPSAPSPTQPRTVNALYRACDRPGRPRSHDRGVACRVSGGSRTAAGTGQPAIGHRPSAIGNPGPRAPALLLIQGPFGLDWRRRKWGVVPRLETSDLSAANPPREERAALWVRQGIHVLGRPEWVFVKLHAHGCSKGSAEVLLGEPMLELHRHLRAAYADGRRWRLHYVTAREMYNIVRAAEEGAAGNPGAYRDFEIGPPPAAE